ncbi:hypothetical protein FOYG_17078 [Fusarium oxysporum NRRL 32931]|uniref:Uncharacterized protein n=1 Tax=Fusarium oxysporum NRRL 32931 TaxID=660029 RepID=W9HB52_FUSOX|nr:hypothetical protein FOYG_17078 [Fusarium oxysporum NRRL 32931]
MSYQKKLVNLIGDMTGRNSLSDWDVLVSYQETKINSLLAERAAKLGITDSMSFTTPYSDPGTGENYTFDITMQLHSPAIQFSDASGSVNLICGITGSYKREDLPRVTPFPDNLQLTLTAECAHVIGEWQDDDFVPSSASTHGPQWIIVDGGDGHNAHAVVVDFTKLSSVNIGNTSSGSNSPGMLAVLNDLIKAFIQQFFLSLGLKYYITALSNSHDPNPKAGMQVLKPVSFCFSIVPGSYSATPQIPGALCIWIGVKGGVNDGQHTPGSTLAGFAPNGTNLTPIPTNNDCSIIFSSAVISNLFLAPALGQWVDNVVAAPNPPEGGMVTNFNFKNVNINVDSTDVNLHDHDDNQLHIDGCNFGTNSPAATITFGPNLVTVDAAPISIAYASNRQDINWNSSYDSEDADGNPFPVRHSGTVGATFTLKGAGQWTQSSDPVNAPNQLGLALTFDKTFGVSTYGEPQSGWDQWFSGKSEAVPDAFQNINPQAPNFQAQIYMDYFLTTNLILPGQYVFKADNPVAMSSTSDHGLATPRDTILTAQMNMDAAAAAIRNANLRKANFLMKSSKVATGLKTVQGLFDELRVQPPKAILGDLVNALRSTDTDADKKCLDLLKSYGYGALTEDNFMAVVQQTSDSAWAQLQSLGHLHKTRHRLAAPVSKDPIDLRYFGGKYIIHSPAAYQGTILKVNPRTAEITYKGATGVPAISVDDATGLTWFQFSRGDLEFKISFQALFTPSTRVFTAILKGTVTTEGNDEVFQGELSDTASPHAQNKLTEEGLGGEEGTATDIFGYIGFAVGIIGLIVPYIWRREDKHSGQELTEAIKANNERMGKGYKLLENGIDKLTKDQVAIDLAKNAAEIAKLEAPFDARLQAEIINELEKVSEADILAFDKNGDLSSAVWKDVMDAANRVVSTQVDTAVRQFTDAQLEVTLKPYVDAHYIDIDIKTKTKEEASKEAVASWKGKFDKPFVAGGKSYIEAKVSSLILRKNIEIRDKQLEETRRIMGMIESGLEQTRAEITERSRDLEIEKAKAQDPTLSEAEREAVEKAAAELQNDLAEAEADAKEQSDSVDAKQRDIDRQSIDRNEADQEREKREKEAEDGRGNAFEHVA